MRKTSSKSVRHFYVSGIQSSIPIATCALRENIKLNDPIRILDFGCGAGRVLLHFTRHFQNPYYYACDIDDTVIIFIKNNYKRVQAYKNSFRPPLIYENSFFDMVYSVSIFSHLCLEDQGLWIEELARITKPGGICFLTTEGVTALKSLTKAFGMDGDTLEEDLKRHGILYKEYGYLEEALRNQNTLKITSHLIGVEGSYGNTIMSPEYIRMKWNTSYFNVTGIIEGIIDYRQDLVILRRK